MPTAWLKQKWCIPVTNLVRPITEKTIWYNVQLRRKKKKEKNHIVQTLKNIMIGDSVEFQLCEFNLISCYDVHTHTEFFFGFPRDVIKFILTEAQSPVEWRPACWHLASRWWWGAGDGKAGSRNTLADTSDQSFTHHWSKNRRQTQANTPLQFFLKGRRISDMFFLV